MATICKESDGGERGADDAMLWLGGFFVQKEFGQMMDVWKEFYPKGLHVMGTFENANHSKIADDIHIIWLRSHVVIDNCLITFCVVFFFFFQ